MRTLVIGAGVAGLTLAARLCQQGRAPVIVEKARAADGGYALGLYPLGSCVLHGLGAYGQLAERAIALERYELASESGRVLQSVSMSVLTAAAGPLYMINRLALLEVLESSCQQAEMRRGVMVESVAQTPEHVDVRFDDGSAERFDAVVGCDGAHSAARRFVAATAGRYESGWLLWTWWAAAGHFDQTTAREWCGAGSFLGIYPAPGRVMCAAGGPATAVRSDEVRPRLRDRLSGLCEREPEVGKAVDELTDPHPWGMADVRCRPWFDRRVALCGDAAAAFLPTAGVGASIAMRSAAGLADELSRSDAADVPLAFERYEKRCRPVAERSQTESRRLARAMFVRHRLTAGIRDQLVRRYPARLALREIIGSVRQPF